jgi:acyl-CoA synthetase (AMP-forming)/AMP-acid ligase II
MRRDLASEPARPVWHPGVAGPSPAQIVRARLAEAPDRVMVRDGAGQLTRRDVHDRGIRLGSALWRRGLRPGSVAAFQLPNWSEACVVSLACALYGFVLCPLLIMYREHELGFILSETGCEALFIPGQFRNTDFPALIGRTQIAHRDRLRVFGVRDPDSAASFDALLGEKGEAIPPPDVQGGRIKSITFTSGTTGRPKGVLHTHDTMLATTLRAAAFWGFDASDRMLVPSPIGHIGGSLYAFELPWATGATAHLMEVWEPAAATAMIEREQLTFCAGATPFLQGLLDVASTTGARLPSLRRFICGGASVPAALVEAATAQFENTVISRAYGSTEVPIICPGVRSRADAFHGQTTDGEIDVDVRLTGQASPDGTGDIEARSTGMFVGYLDADDEKDAFTPDGYFRMGDIGRIVDGRYIEITGRRKEIIIRMGENISPQEVENVLLQCPAIERAAVIGIPDARTGERAVAFVALRPGHDLTMAQMQDFLTGAGLARQKIPEALHVLPSIPTNSIGKIVKADLKRIALEGTA